MSNTKLQPDETKLTGQWIFVDGRMISDDVEERIDWLIENELELLGHGNWSTLYRDKADGRLWEVTYPQSEMHGGGPRSMKEIDTNTVTHKYGIAILNFKKSASQGAAQT